MFRSLLLGRTKNPHQFNFIRSHSSTNVNKVNNGKSVEIKWSDGQKSKFGSFWLRDHCKCEECWHPVTKQRLFNTFSVPRSITAKQVTLQDSPSQPLKGESREGAKGEMLKVEWPDGHKSQYDLEWMKRHSYNPPVKSQPLVPTYPKKLWNKQSWSSTSTDLKRPSVGFEEVMSSDVGLAKWLQNIMIYGFSWVDGVPVTPEDTERLARRIAFIRETHYGQFWDFTSNLAHGDTAYTSLAIGAHTDTTYFTDPIGLQLFHLLEHRGEGGKTLLVDTFHVAEELKRRHPQYFKVLSEMKIPTHSAGDESILITPTPHAGFPVINIDEFSGEVFQVRFNNHDRSVMSGKYFTAAQIDLWYEAAEAWSAMLKSEQNEFWVKMQPGSAIVVDNWRVMHGRSSFTGYRRLSGAYINWDDYMSRVNMILNKGLLKSDL